MKKELTLSQAPVMMIVGDKKRRMKEMDEADVYNQGFCDYYNSGERDSRFDDCASYQAGFMAAMVRCQKPFKELVVPVESKEREERCQVN